MRGRGGGEAWTNQKRVLAGLTNHRRVFTWRRRGAIPGVVDGVTLELLKLLTQPRDPVNAVNILKTNNQETTFNKAVTMHSLFSLIIAIYI